MNDFKRLVLGIAKSERDASKFALLLEELFDVIDPEAIGDAFKLAIGRGDLAAAVKACADHFRRRPDFPAGSGFQSSGPYDAKAVEKYIEGIFTVVDVEWAFPDGEIDYLFNPTSVKGPLNHEWVWQFNRHFYWADLARAYTGTGNEKYAKTFAAHLLKWLSQTGEDTPDAWRTIECGLRLGGPWPVAFDGFKKSREINDILLLLMVASMHRQSTYLTEGFTGGNWLMIQLSGVYSFSALFPELKDSVPRRQMVEKRIVSDVAAQVLPDGMQFELSPDYHFVTLVSALKFCTLARSLGLDVDNALTGIIKKMVDAAISLSTPALTQPCTNDCYVLQTSKYIPETVLKLFGELPAYRYVLSRRAEGAPPEGETASVFLPYAGFAAMRADWSSDSAYLCFDVGPLGAGHMHQDMLNIIVFKGSRQLIYDDGGGQYDQSVFRRYSLSGHAHNTVLVDGLAQDRRGPLVSTKPIDAGWISNDIFDYARGTYDGSFGSAYPATHKREVRFCKPGFFIVADTLTSIDGNAHDYEVLFQLDTEKVRELSEYTNGIISQYGGEYEVAIIPLDPVRSELRRVSGSEDPIRGWCNGRNGVALHKATTVSRTLKNTKNGQFVTLLFPVRAGDALPDITFVKGGSFVNVVFEGRNYEFDLDGLYR